MQCVPLRVVLEGLRVVAGVLAGLAQGEMEVHAVHVVERGVREVGAHGGEIRVGEAEGLEVGEAPVGLPEHGV